MAVNGGCCCCCCDKKMFWFPSDINSGNLLLAAVVFLRNPLVRDQKGSCCWFGYWKRVWPVKDMYMFHSLQSSVMSTLREELPIREKNAQDRFWKTKTKTAKNWSRGAKTGELQHRINPAVDHNSYSTVRQRGIQTNCDVQGWKIRFTIRHRHDGTMI